MLPGQQLPFFKKLSTLRWLFLVAALLFIIKLCLLPFAQAVDADGITRILMTRQWLENPSIIKEGTWLPLYFYLMGFALKIYDNQFYTPVIVNIILSILTLFPLYFFVRRIFSAPAGFFICVLFALSPIVFRISFLALSETPFIFFLMLGANLLSKGLMENKNRLLVLSGFVITIAGGFRYESWIISGLAALVLASRFSFRQSILFFIPAFLFPVYWIISNYTYGNGMVHEFSWATSAIHTNSFSSAEDVLRRIWWYPLSLFFAFGLIGFIVWIREIIFVFRNRKSNPAAFLFLVVFFIFFLVILLNCFFGSLLMQHRFTLSLFVLAIPFLGFYFNEINRERCWAGVLIPVVAISSSFIYNSRGITPVPRLQEQTADEISKIMRTGISNSSGLIVDSWNYESTYYLAFMSGLPQSHIAIFDQNPRSLEFEIGTALNVMEKYPQGFLVFSANGILSAEMPVENGMLVIKRNGQRFMVELIRQSKDIKLYKYQKE